MKIRQLFLLFFLALALLAIAGIPIGTQVEIEAGGNNPFIAGRNVNMVSGTRLPLGDPWLQRQNEPSIAVSTRNPMHLFAGANDYRTIDIPRDFQLPGIEGTSAADAWLGVYESFDGGQSWITTLLPGYPRDFSADGTASPIQVYETACDPIVRAGANGLFYYCGIAFNRTTKASAVFVARYMDNNNLEKVKVKIDQGVRKYFGPIQYIDTKLVATGNTSSSFIDMPNLAVDVPRKGALYGNIYVAYTVFESGTADKISFQRSTDGGVTYGTPVQLSTTGQLVQRPVIAIDPSDLKGNTIYVAFRRFARGTVPGGIVVVKSTDGGKTFSKPTDVAALPYPFDHGTSNYSFRTNSYPTMTIDGLGTVYVAWAQRQGGPNGQARIVISALRKIILQNGETVASTGIEDIEENGDFAAAGNTKDVKLPDLQIQGASPVWTTPKVVDSTYTGIGHQFMPALTYAGWNLMLAWYDQREDPAKDASQFIEDSPGQHRHTIDVRAAEGKPGVPPSFSPSVQLSRYLYVLDLDANGNPIEEGDYYKVIQAESNPINYPLFQLGTVPFHGDYMEITPSPRILPPAVAFGYWIYNVNPLEPTIFHTAWTDNRDVRPPDGDNWGDWVNYSAPNSAQDSGWEGPACKYGGNTGMRNQNVYTANINKGTIVGSPGNTKQLDLSSSTEGGRTFVVYIKNATGLEKKLNLLILEIGGVNASFDQFKNDDQIQVKVEPYSSVSSSVYVDRSSRTLAPVTVNAFEGLKLVGYVILNPDPTNLPVNDPNNPLNNLGHETHNPDVSAPTVWNYDVGSQDEPNPSAVLNPRVKNTADQNYSVVNPRVKNEDVLNPRVKNESIVNNEVANPRVKNAGIENTALTDVTWTVTNEGNTTSAYTLNIESNVPDYFNGTNPLLIAQVLVYKVHKVPIDKDCQLYEAHQDELMVNIANPRVKNSSVQSAALSNTRLSTQSSSMSTQAADLSAQDVTFHLAPNEVANVTFRVWDENTADGSVIFSPNMVTSKAVAEAVNTDDVEQGRRTPPYDYPPNPTPWNPLTPSPEISTGPTAMSFSASLGGGNPAPQTLDIWNSAWVSGGENLSYTIEDDANWLTVNPIAGTTSGANHVHHTVSVNATGLGAGTYFGTITISSPYATNNPMRAPVTLTVYATPPPPPLNEWVARYDGPSHSDESAVDVASDSAGNVYVTGASPGVGTSQDILTIKYNALGSVVWTARYDADHSAPNNNESPTAIEVDSTGNVYVTGTQQGAYSFRNSITIKYNNLGVQQWAMEYDRNAQADDIPRAIAVDATGNVYVTGESSTLPGGYPDFYTIKYDPSGNQIWASIYAGFGGSDMAKALALDSSGNVYVAGTSLGTSLNFDYALVKYDNSGAELWVRRYDGQPAQKNDQVSVLAVDSSGNVYVSGSSEGTSGSLDYCTIKFDSNGEVLWISRYDRVGGHDLVNAMAVDSSGNVYVTGRSDYGLGPDPLSDYATVKYDNSGTQRWVRLYDGPDHVQDVARAMAIDPAGNVYVAGESDGVGTSFDYATIKYDGNGNELWVRRYNGSGNFNDSAAAVAIDPAGSVLITGTSSGSGTGTDFATIKYRPTLQEWVAYSGQNLTDGGNAIALDSSGNAWVTGQVTLSLTGGQVASYQILSDGTPGMGSMYANPSGSADDAGKSIAVHSATGDVYVAGTIHSSGTELDYFTQKIIPSIPGGGWVQLYNGSSSGTDEVNAMTIDAAGNVYVTGRSWGADYDYATIKYNSTGNSMWTPDLYGDIDASGAARYSGSGQSDDAATAIAVDSSGNVYVTGWTDVDPNAGFSFDYLTIKYDNTGHRVWTQSYNVGTEDRAFAIAVDSSGNVYVTGSAGDFLTNKDCVTIKYNSAGTVVWAKPYAGPVSGTDIGGAIAVDSSDNVYVTGARWGGTDVNADYLTIKYDKDGTELWVRTYNGPRSNWDQALDLALDSSGNVVVTGLSYGISPNTFDYATIKYDPNGNELWVMRYNGVDNNDDEARALAVDSSGNVFVTGKSLRLGSSYDYATVKYRKEGT